MRTMFGGVTIVCTIFCLVLLTVRLYFGITMDMKCGDYLGRAAKANSIELAVENLNVAIKHMEAMDWTQGNTGVIFHYPEYDVGFWYKNIVSSRDELVQLPKTATTLEKSNALMKLRESIIHHSSGGEELSCPSGISVFPYNGIFLFLDFLGVISVLAATIFGFLYFEMRM